MLEELVCPMSGGPRSVRKLQQWEECSHPLRPVTRPGFRRKKGKVATGPRFPYKPNTPAKNPSAQCFGNWHSSWSIHIVGRSVKSLSVYFRSPQPLRTDVTDWRVMTAQKQRKQSSCCHLKNKCCEDKAAHLCQPCSYNNFSCDWEICKWDVRQEKILVLLWWA